MFSQNKKGITSPGMKPNAITQAILLAGITCIAPSIAMAGNHDAVELNTVNVEANSEVENGVPVSRKVSTTGTKTATPLNKTPQSVSVVTSEDIEEKGVSSVADSLAYSAGVVTNYRGTSNRNDEVMARGMNSYLPQYLDGISFASGSSGQNLSPQIDPWLLERVELIHGPASVLYGQSNPGGLISMTSKRPTEESVHTVEVGYGTDNQREAAFDFGGAATDDGKVLFRISGITRAKDGQENYVEEERYAIAPSLTFKPTDATTLTLLASFQKDPSAGYRNFLPSQGTVKSNPNGSIPTDFFMSDPNWEQASRNQKSAGYAFEHSVNNALTLRQNLRFTDLQQDTQTLIYDYWATSSYDVMSRWAQKFDQKAKTFGIDNQAEYKFATGATEHTVLAGVDYKTFTFRETDWTDYNSDGDLNIDWTNPTYGIDTRNIDLKSTANEKQSRKQTGIYLQDQIALDRWNFVISGRNDWADLDLDDYLYSSSDSTQIHKATGRAGILYAFDNGLSPYISYSTSFEPITYKGADGKIMKPTTAKQTEVGVKYQPHGSRSSVTAAVYDLKQQNVASYDTSSYSYQQTGEVGSKGFELETNLQLTGAWKVTTAYAYTDAEILKDETASNVGLAPQWIPEHSGSLWNTYEFTNGLTAGAGWRYVGTTYNRANTTKTPAYGLYDASLNYDLGTASNSLKGAKVQLTVNNIFDKKYVSSCASDYACFYGAERSAMLKVNYAW